MNEMDPSTNNNDDDLSETSATASLGGAKKITSTDSIKLRDWWHRILGIYDRYPSCAFFLLLPSHQEVVLYLTQYSQELHIISGKTCLVIALSDREGLCTDFDEDTWAAIIDSH